jgi:hypothetical protein
MLPTARIKKATALALALSATIPGAAYASPIGPHQTPITTPTTPIVRVTVPAPGFDWGDAAIGAAGGLAIAMLGVGSALTFSQRRNGHPRHRAPRTS